MGWYQRRVHGEIFPDCHSSKMRSLTALLVIGCVAAGSIRPYSWTPSKEYKYKYSTQVLTGIPELNEQFSGLRLVSYVRVQPKQDYTLRIKLEENWNLSLPSRSMRLLFWENVKPSTLFLSFLKWLLMSMKEKVVYAKVNSTMKF